MTYAKGVGRPTKMNISIMAKLADALKNNYTVGDACKWARIGRTTFYRHMNNNEVFATKMNYAIECRDKVSFNFGTSY